MKAAQIVHIDSEYYLVGEAQLVAVDGFFTAVSVRGYVQSPW